MAYLRYIIVDYERSNFSVSQCRFEDGEVPIDLVAIPSATKKPNHLRRNVAIGTGITIALFILLATLAAIFAIRRWRAKTTVQPSSETTELSTLPQEPRASIISSSREIGNNSIAGPIRELPDSALVKAELLNAQAPSGSGNQIFEMSEAVPPIFHELRTHGSSPAMVHKSIANSHKIFTSTKVSGKSRMSVASSSGSPFVGTVMSILGQRKEIAMNRVSIATSNLEAEILSSYLRKSLNLDKSLPPTPISESPQVSPVLARFNQRSSFTAHNR